MTGLMGWPHRSSSTETHYGTLRPIDAVPDAPDMMDDEFNGTAIDSKWTLSAPSGTPTVTFSNGLCQFTPYVTGSYDIQAMWQLLPASGDWAFTLALDECDGMMFAYGTAGLLALSSGTSGTAGSGIMIGSALWGGTGIVVNLFSSWNSWGGTLMNPSGGLAPKYLRATKSGSTYTLAYSSTGMTFDSAYSGTLGFTPERILIGSKTEASRTATANFKWFRKTA